MNALKKQGKRVWAFCLRHKAAILLALPLILMDFCVRSMASHVSFYPLSYPIANLFTLSWVVLFVGLSLCLRGNLGKVLYWVCFLPFWVLYLTHGIYYGMTEFYFSFSLMQLASEGSGYIWDAITGAHWWVWALAAGFLALGIFATLQMPKREKGSGKRALKVALVCLGLHLLAFVCLGRPAKELKWNTFKNPRHVYDDFSDINKSMRVTGLFEYTFRNLYKTALPPQNEPEDADDVTFLENAYNAEDPHKDNDYTGIFKGKNVIFLQLEGIDTWLLTQDTMPNLYALRQQSIDFTNHFSIYTGGGSTFNSEFAVNTGFTTPISYVENVYSFHKNCFDQSLAKKFKAAGYRVNAFHMNSAEFYSRGINYQNWGYDNYYGLMDLDEYDGIQYELDRELILNETFHDAMFGADGKFLNYIITYTPHTPFTTEKGVGKLVAEMRYGDEIPEMTEEECARMMAGETDFMIDLLMQTLKAEGLYDNTVIVAYADHYLYTLEDKTVLDTYKNTENNRINNTPFFIWSSDLTPEKVDDVTMQTNILPTVLNLFGLDYNSNDYLCQDALADDYQGIAFFSDYSWYDGALYVENGQITEGKVKDSRALIATNKRVNDLIRKNDLTLKCDYFRTIAEEEPPQTNSREHSNRPGNNVARDAP